MPRFKIYPIKEQIEGSACKRKQKNLEYIEYKTECDGIQSLQK